MKLSSLSILIPAYKDEDTIRTVVRCAARAGRNAAKTFEIVVIDDASPDRTGVYLDTLAKSMKGVRVVHHKKNRGYGETMRELYLSGKKQWLFTVPGDYQIDAIEVMKLIPYTHDADMVIGWRTVRHDTLRRKIQSQIYNFFVRMVFGVQLHDMNSVRLMKRTFLKGIVLDGSTAFVDAKMTLDGIRLGRTVTETPIVHKPRKTGGASGGKLKIILPVIRQMVMYVWKNA